MGGALALRAAAFEKRIKICIANPGVLSWADAILGHFTEYPQLLQLLEASPEAFDAAVWQFFKTASLPPPARAVLDGLGDVGRLDALAAGQIRDDAGQLEDAMVRSRAHLQLTHGRPQQAAAGLVNLAELPNLGRPMSALQRNTVLANRSRSHSRAASTWAWITAEFVFSNG